MPDPVKRQGAGRLVAALTILFAIAAAAMLFRPVTGKAPPVRKPAPLPKVDVARLDEAHGDEVLREQASLLDPTPLFLPTPWNASQRPLPATVEPQPGQVFAAYGAKWVFGTDQLTLPIPVVRFAPGGPRDLLKQPLRDPFLGFDRQDEPLTPLAERFGVIEVRRLADDRLELTRRLDQAVPLPAGRLDWQPAEFMVTVTVAGLLGRPVNTVSSDVEEVDIFLRDYLAKTLHLGERLAPGIYRVVVGP